PKTPCTSTSDPLSPLLPPPFFLLKKGAADELGGILHHCGHLHHPHIRGREPPRHPRHPTRPRPHQEGFHI
ncbi:MAG: hypothetical protein ACK559_38740, partial [bacterium]